MKNIIVRELELSDKRTFISEHLLKDMIYQMRHQMNILLMNQSYQIDDKYLYFKLGSGVYKELIKTINVELHVSYIYGIKFDVDYTIPINHIQLIYDDSSISVMRPWLTSQTREMKTMLNSKFGLPKTSIPNIKKVIFSPPATIVIWNDGDKTVVKDHDEDFDKEKGLAMAICKKVFGTNKSKSNYNDIFKKWITEE